MRNRDDKNPHGNGYPWEFSPFEEDTEIILYPITYSGKGQ